MNTHRLKTWRAAFAAIRSGEKTFEHRLDDRGFREGDILILAEWDEDRREWTGREERRRVSYILQGGRFGVTEGHVIMALQPMPLEQHAAPETAEDVARHHSVEASRQLGLASNWVREAQRSRAHVPPLTVAADRAVRCAEAAQALAAFHAESARIVRQQANAVRVRDLAIAPFKKLIEDLVTDPDEDQNIVDHTVLSIVAGGPELGDTAVQDWLAFLTLDIAIASSTGRGPAYVDQPGAGGA